MLNFFDMFFMRIDQIFQGNILAGDEKVPRFLPYVFSKFFIPEIIRLKKFAVPPSAAKNHESRNVYRAKADIEGDFKELYRNFDIIFEITFIIGLSVIIDVARSLTALGSLDYCHLNTTSAQYSQILIAFLATPF
jgi:hypothetical protein